MKKETGRFMAGMVTGAMLFSGGAAYAAGILAEHSPQTAYVDGVTVQLDAYNIGGYNYVKLRDIGQAVGFNVYYDGQSVQMDSDAPYTGAGPVQAATANTTAGGITVGSFRGSTLKVGERSPLTIYPSDSNVPIDNIFSSDPAVLKVEYFMNHRTILAQSPGTATVTATTVEGRTGSTTITVVPENAGTAPATPSTPTQPVTPAVTPNGVDLSANMEIRLEMIWLINEVRRENGVAELPVNEALMNAAQDVSSRKYTTHHTREECETAMAYGYPHGFGNNLTVFSGTAPQYIAKCAVANWVNSPGHFQAMIDPLCDSIGVGVTISGGRAYCHMYAGDSNSHHPYE